MIRLFIFSLMTIIVALWVTLYLGFPGDPGYLLIAFGNYTFETSLFALMVAGVVVYLVYWIVAALLRIFNPARWVRAGKKLANRRRSGKASRTIEGLLHLTRRNWKAAYSTLTRATRDQDSSVVNYLAAALAAFEMGDRDTCMRCLNKAEKEFPSAHSTIHSLKAQLLFRSGQLEQCLAILEMLRKTALNDEPLLRLLKEVYLQLGEWEKLDSIVPTLHSNGIIDDAERSDIEERILIEELRKVRDKHAAGKKADLVKALEKRWKKAGAHYKFAAGVILDYSRLLYESDAKEEAAKIIEQALNKSWKGVLIHRYGERDFDCSAAQLLIAEGWLKSRPADATLLLCLARLAMRSQLWGKAKDYYRASIKISPSIAAYGELGRLLENLGEHEAAKQCQENYHALNEDDLLDLPQPKPQPPQARQAS